MSYTKWAISGIMLIVLSIPVLALPESPHPYPNNCDQIQTFTATGSLGLEVTFSSETCVADGDFIILTDGQGRVIGKFEHDCLAGLTIGVEGDTLNIRLVSDDEKNAYGYAFTSVRTLHTRAAETVTVDYSRADTLADDDLKAELYNLTKGNVALGYNLARQKMFGQIDNENGYVACVYTGRLVKTTVIPNGSDMNTEHSWPQSLGAENEPAKSDLNHLYPTDSETNSRRSSYPFGNVYTVTWTKGNSSLGKDQSGTVIFQPRPEHRGNLARSMFYFSIRYKLALDAKQEQALKQWNREDPVDAKEAARTDEISTFQKTRNPFVDHPEYADRIADF